MSVRTKGTKQWSGTMGQVQRLTTRRLRLSVIAGVVAIGLAAAIWQLNVLEVRARSQFATISSAFDTPPAYPGYRWSRDESSASSS